MLKPFCEYFILVDSGCVKIEILLVFGLKTVSLYREQRLQHSIIMPPMCVMVVPVYDAIQETGNHPDDADFSYLSSLRTMRTIHSLFRGGRDGGELEGVEGVDDSDTESNISDADDSGESDTEIIQHGEEDEEEEEEDREIDREIAQSFPMLSRIANEMN